MPHLRLFKTNRGGDCGNRNLQQRIRLFGNGDWDRLLQNSREASSRSSSAPIELSLETKLKRALHYAQIGELSYVAHELQSAGLAFGCADNLAELYDPALRPESPSEPIPKSRVGNVEIVFDKDIFGAVVFDLRRGVSGGLAGLQNKKKNSKKHK